MPKTGRSLIGTVADFQSEWWPVFDRIGGRLHVGIPTSFLEDGRICLTMLPSEHFEGSRSAESHGSSPDRVVALTEPP